MKITNYEQIDSMGLDVLKEIGSIGIGNAATALASMLSREIKMTQPDVSIMGYNDAVYKLGGPEKIVVGVLTRITGDIKGLMLYIQDLKFINIVLKNLMSEEVESYEQLGEMEISAIMEIGNIIISSYINSLTSLVGISAKLSVPCISTSMLGGILSVPMIEFGYETDKIMTIGGSLVCDEQEIGGNLILVPEMESLNSLFEKLGIQNG
ncbi:MAG: chemotaxis protein CheC [Proteocatella sp.]